MKIIQEQLISLVKKNFDWMAAKLTEDTVTDIGPRAKAQLRRLYEQTQHWPKDRQIQRVSEYKKRWERWTAWLPDNLPSLCIRRRYTLFAYLPSPCSSKGKSKVGTPVRSLIFFSCFCFALWSPYSVADFPSGPYEPSGSTVWTGQYRIGSGTNNNVSFCAGNNAGYTIFGQMGNGTPAWGTVDGHTGLVIGNGVVIYFEGHATIQNPLIKWALEHQGMSSDIFSINFSKAGVTGPSSFNVVTGIYPLLHVVPSNILHDDVIYGGSAYMATSLRAHLYISRDAEPGTYTIVSPLYIRGPCSTGVIYGGGNLIDAGDIVVALPPRVCSISISPDRIVSPPQIQSMMSTIQQTGTIGVTGSCTLGDTSPTGNVQFSIIADNPVSSAIGGVNSALALVNSNKQKVGSVYFQNNSLSSSYLSVDGNKYGVPVQWSNINFDVKYTVVDLAPSDTQTFGVGRGTAKFIVEWP